ncbi:Glycylpeptide N-tetradecanoyltransferase 1 [Zea mays]|uniref:glycylpeptide N-tetradecanoyltransferase n=1 Tax=Zea mays TaxID=4577 RepID=A0A1D6G321_MAIZE|nr:Glycylpeptide N-tetradecanoyltransferase 1 [Zea mays]
MFRFNYSPAFLRWALKPPSFFRAWHIGVRAKESKKLVAFISGVPPASAPATTSSACRDQLSLRPQEAPIQAPGTRAHPGGHPPRPPGEHLAGCIHRGIVLPTPITTCRYWHRSLNPKKLIDVGFSRLVRA